MQIINLQQQSYIQASCFLEERDNLSQSWLEQLRKYYRDNCWQQLWEQDSTMKQNEENFS